MNDECDHVVGIYIFHGDHGEAEVDVIKVSDGYNKDVLDEVFKFCPMCGEKV